MATLIVIMLLVGFSVVGYVMWLMWKEIRAYRKELQIYQTHEVVLNALSPIETSVNDIRTVLTEASRIKHQKTEGDTIPSMGRTAYVPIARRRAFAESASLGPVTHDAKVRENNTRAIESAG